MGVEIIIPEGLWEEDQEGVLATWFYQSGEHVEHDATVAEILTEKVAHEVIAPATGILEILVEEEAVVTAGSVIAPIK